MKKKYSISFFAAIIIFAFLLTAAYHFEYQKVRANAKSRCQKKTEHNASLQTEGTAKRADKFYLKSLNGFIVVYLKDQKTIYEYTDIHIDDLPENVAEQLKTGIIISSEESLYSFLEGYSS